MQEPHSHVNTNQAYRLLRKQTIIIPLISRNSRKQAHLIRHERQKSCDRVDPAIVQSLKRWNIMSIKEFAASISRLSLGQYLPAISILPVEGIISSYRNSISI